MISCIRKVCLRQGLSLLTPKDKLLVIPCATQFWEPSKKSEYADKLKFKKSKSQMAMEGLKLLKPEVKLWAEEVKTKFRCDSIIPLEAGDYEILWKFDNQETIDEWIVSTDEDVQGGKSSAELVLGKNKTGIFQGYISTETPKDGMTKHSGYANMRSPKQFISFKRQRPYDWERYNCLLVRCRGDGRPFALNLAMDRYFDINWNDLYSYPLFTRGGPYWQIAKIPFSKFFLNAKGRTQDKQESVMTQLDSISHLSITLGEGVAGPFQLEIDYIGLLFDANHKEHFAYEQYAVSPYVHC